MRFFKEVVSAGNVSLASKRLGVNQSTVSRRIAELEKKLGKFLFERTTSGWVITPAGESIVGLTEDMSERVREIERKIKADSEEVRGLLRITSVDVCLKQLMIPAIVSFTKLYPEVDIELITSENPLNLASREADIALRGTSEPPLNLVGKHIGKVAISVYGNKQFLKRKEPQCITWVGDGITIPPWIKKNHPKVKRPIRTNSAIAMLEMCQQGVGIAQLPCLLGETAKSLVKIPVGFVESGFDLWVLSHVDLRTTVRVRLFRDHLVQYLMNNIDLIEGRVNNNTIDQTMSLV